MLTQRCLPLLWYISATLTAKQRRDAPTALAFELGAGSRPCATVNEERKRMLSEVQAVLVLTSETRDLAD